LFECRSCLEDGVELFCPACQGRVRFTGTCPTCEGSGEITRTRRHGVAVFPTRSGLYRYLAERDAHVADRLVVELEGRLSGDNDLDADTGALLALPERIVAVQPLDTELIEQIQARLGAVA
jgi:RecJ-like exonuclease